MNSIVIRARTRKGTGASAPVTGFVKSRRGTLVYLGLAGHKTALKAIWATVVDRSRPTFEVGSHTTWGLSPKEGGKYRQFWSELPEVMSHHCVVALEDLTKPDPKGERPFYVVVYDDGTIQSPPVKDEDVAERSKQSSEWDYSRRDYQMVTPLCRPGTDIKLRVIDPKTNQTVLAVDCPAHWDILRAAAQREALGEAAHTMAHTRLIGLLNQTDAAPFLDSWSAFLWERGRKENRILSCSTLGDALAAFEVKPGPEWAKWAQEGLRAGQLHFE